MIQLSVNAKKELNRGADQILGDGRIVMGMERDNHKEIENCQTQKKDEEIIQYTSAGVNYSGVHYRYGVQYMKDRYKNIHRVRIMKRMDFRESHTKEGVP